MNHKMFPISDKAGYHGLDIPLVLLSYNTHDHISYDSESGAILPRSIELHFSGCSKLEITSKKWEYGDHHGLVIDYKE